MPAPHPQFLRMLVSELSWPQLQLQRTFMLAIILAIWRS